MPIPSSVPSTLRTPGSYQEFDFSKAGPALALLARRVCIIAEKTAAGTAVIETPIQLFGEADGDTKLGKGSLASLLNRQALYQAKISGLGCPEIWACPIAESGGVAAQYTITVTGPATESKDLILEVCGRTLTIGVTNGDAQNTIASAIKNKLDELKAVLPVTAAVAANVVTITFTTKGTNGNDVQRKSVQVPAGVTIAHAATVVGTLAASIANALAALYDKDYDLIVFSNHATADAATILADAAFAWGFGQKSYRHYIMGERGTLGTAQTLQASYNDYRVLIASAENCKSLPGEMAMATGLAWMARDLPNANLDGERLGLFPPDPVDVYTATEVESALATGLTPITVDGIYAKIVRLTTSQITLGGAPFEPLREPALARTAAYMAKQYDIGFVQEFKQEVLFDDPDGGDDPLQRARDMVIKKMRAAQRLRILREVDSFLQQIVVEISATVPGRIVIQDPMKVAGPLHEAAFLNLLYLA